MVRPLVIALLATGAAAAASSFVSGAAEPSSTALLTINNPESPTGTVGVAYPPFGFTASNGVAPLTWSEMPPLTMGLSLTKGGVLSGMPTSDGHFLITLKVTDALNHVAHAYTTVRVSLARPPASFTPTGSMTIPRSRHTATLLLTTGEVLVTGGGNGRPDVTAELYNPATGTFTRTTGNMLEARSGHTATVLGNPKLPNYGKVLIVGGNTTSGDLKAELYETTDPASNCSPNSPSQLFQFFAATWRPAKGEIKRLPPLPGDTLSNATGINDSGLVVGTSGNCVLGPIEAVLWRDGKPINLGILGGAVFNIAFGINNQGQVVGQSDLPGDIAHHAFLWENGVITDLGTLPGIASSLAASINNRGQVVGFSDDGNGNTVALLWQNGTMTDLNTLIPVDSPWFLLEALGINDRGQIVGYASNASTGDVQGIILTPVENSESSTSKGAASKRPPVLPEKVRQMLTRRMDARLHWSSPPR
jgi:probable HAF family extracellular repeat protein